MVNLTEHKCAGNCSNHMEACYIEKKKQVELLQTEVARLNNKNSELNLENTRLQKIIDLMHEAEKQEAGRIQEIHSLIVESL
ncbi:hypothetical protein [Acinetobacter sp. MD2(2019)]|uniref:hypothetical protein n=1 Tax=Acinetobacter sp. MD2(2019) TaxID=2605273 RepID=UPI002D1F113D|nr:hypothetical protein [Acinetobacter sp. MD2(2019)]MEB3753811.1 hypothetical protein [Acinetobacter sp. MD2(2019)]